MNDLEASLTGAWISRRTLPPSSAAVTNEREGVCLGAKKERKGKEGEMRCEFFNYMMGMGNNKCDTKLTCRTLVSFL